MCPSPLAICALINARHLIDDAEKVELLMLMLADLAPRNGAGRGWRVSGFWRAKYLMREGTCNRDPSELVFTLAVADPRGAAWPLGFRGPGLL